MHQFSASYPVIYQPRFDGPINETLIDSMGLAYTSFYFTCNVEYTGSNETVDDGARFDVAFLFNDVELVNLTATDLNASSLSVRIDPQHFKYNFGKLVCFVDCRG